MDGKRLERSIELNRFIKRVGWLSTLAILFTMSRVHAETQTNSPGGNVSTGQAGALTHADIDQILSNARQAMAQGDLAKAETLVKRAEAVNPKYPVLHFGDTPARVRRDLDKLAQSRPAGKQAPAAKVAKENGVTNPFTAAQAAAPASTGNSSALMGSAPHVNIPAATTPAGTREDCDAEILAGRRALIVGDLVQAAKHLEQAQACGVAYTDGEDSPATLAQSVADLKQLKGNQDDSSSWKYNYAKFLTGQGQILLGWGDLDNAERAASEASQLVTAVKLADPAPNQLLARIAQTRKERNNANNQVIVDQAIAPAAAALPVDLTLPTLEEAATPEVPRLAQLPTPEPLPATDTTPPTPNLMPEQMDGFALLQEGEIALRAGDRNQALRLFRMAHAKRNEIDLENQQRLQDHLQMLASNPTQGASQADSNLLEDASTGQAMIAQQLSADIGKRQAEAHKLRESEPRKSLAILQEAAEVVTKSELDESTKTQLLRRLSLSTAETERYIKDHSAELELDEANAKVLADVERERAVKEQLRTKMAEMVDQFNQLRDEQRYGEMEVVAKRLYDMAPDDPVAQQVWENAKFIRRTILNNEIQELSESGVANAFLDIRKTSAEALADSTNPINYDAETWDKIVNRKGATDRDGYKSKQELEIQKKLKTPVLPNYDKMPLSQVIDSLSKLAGINIYLDPRGLGQEGVEPDTPVSLTLSSEVSLESALNLILEPLHLTYMIKDEVLKITSEQIRDGEMVRVVYNVADLVIPIPNFVPSSNMGLQGLINDAYANMPFSNGSRTSSPVAMVPTAPPGGGGTMPGGTLAQQFGNSAPGGSSVPVGGGPGGLGGAANADFDSLIDLIVSTVEYDTWMENGSGEGEIQPFPTNLSLVVSQTQRVHEQIVDLLEQLRRLQDLQVTIEVRFIRLTDSFFERIGIDFDFNIRSNSSLTSASITPNYQGPSATVGISADPDGLADPLPDFTVDLDVPFRQGSFGLASPQFGGPQTVGEFGFAILSDIEAFFLINASQGDIRANVLQAPKVTLFNGQQGIVADTSLRPFVISVIPVVGEFAAAQQPVIVVLSEGTLLTVQAVVSDDRKYVRLTLVPFFSQIGDVDTFTFEGSETTSTSSSTTEQGEDNNSDEETEEVIRSGTTVQLPTFDIITVATTVSVPDGGTVLLGGIKRLREGRNEFGVPLLSKIAYVDRLFRNVGIGRETDSLMMMVTPHIIIQEEEEERLGINQGE